MDAHSKSMPALSPTEPEQTIADAIARTPEWIRTGLSSHDPHLREQAEIALAAMIAAALRTAS